MNAVWVVLLSSPFAAWLIEETLDEIRDLRAIIRAGR